MSQLRALMGLTLGTRNLHMPIALSVLLVLAGYYAGGIVGIYLGFPPSGIAAIWPATAILLAALLLAPPRYWWMYLLGAVPTHLHVASFQVPEVPLVVMLSQVGSNVLHVVLAALALRFVIGAPPRLDSLRNMGAFILLAGVVATAVACLVAVWLFLLTGWAADFWLAWRQRVLANVFAIVTIPPVIVLAFTGQLVGAQHATWRTYLELALITVGVLVVGIPVFGLELAGPSNLPALVLAPLPFLMWAAVRVGVGGTGLSLLIVAGIALANAYVGRGPFINQAPDVNVFSLQIFLTAISIPILLLAALVEERRLAEELLRQTGKQAELALAERNMQLALAGKAALVGTYSVNLGTGRVQLSAGCAAIHGFPEGTSEIWRDDWRAGVHPDDLARLDGLFSQAFAEHWPEYTADYRIIRSGEIRWIEARAFMSYNSDGCAERIVGVNIDISERKRAEAAIEESEARYRALYDDNPSMYFTVDASGTVLSVNDFGARQLGYTPAELVGQSVLRVIHEEDRNAAQRHLASSTENPQTIAATELRKVHRDGSIMWVKEVARAVRGVCGQQTVFLIVCEEITDRKRAEEHQRMLVAELDHRVKNALATVCAVTSFTQVAGGSVADFVAALDGRVKSMAATHQLLSSHQWKGILLSDLLGRELAPYAAHGNTEIDGPDVMLQAEAAQAVSMVLHELATNAAKHGALSTHDGQVSVRWHRVLNGEADARLRIEWQESGGPAVQAPDRFGYGMEIIRDLLPYELDGKVDVAFAAEGVRCRFDIPVSQPTSGAGMRLGSIRT